MKKMILIVEDEKALRDALSNALSVAGLEVLQAENGTQGLSIAVSSQPDLIITDITMPQMSGFQMMLNIREGSEWGKRVPVMYLTNRTIGNEEERADIESTLPAAYLIKSDTALATIVAKAKNCLDIS